jgi:hypothetical protein
MPHSYTNDVMRQDDIVTKAYLGPDAARRHACEAAVLQGLAGRLPVAAVLGGSGASIQLSLMPGVHGQDLINAGLADQVLHGCGYMLRRIHAVALPWLGVAWCEWIMRMHHPGHAGALSAFFDVYGHRPGWPARQQAMAAGRRLGAAVDGSPRHYPVLARAMELIFS